MKQLNQQRSEALAAHELAHALMAQRIQSKFKPFKEGDLVWLEAKNINLGVLHRKLKPKREGPFPITKVISPWAYKLQLPEQWKIFPVFHACLLSLYKATEAHGPSYSEPPPDIIEGEEEYEIEAIVGHSPKNARKPRKFLVKWLGYPSSENTWYKPEELSHANEILDEYKRTHNLL